MSEEYFPVVFMESLVGVLLILTQNIITIISIISIHFTSVTTSDMLVILSML